MRIEVPDASQPIAIADSGDRGAARTRPSNRLMFAFSERPQLRGWLRKRIGFSPEGGCPFATRFDDIGQTAQF